MAEEYIKANGYEGVETLIDELPKTWIPALTRKIVETGYAKNVWLRGGCSVFVAKIEAIP